MSRHTDHFPETASDRRIDIVVSALLGGLGIAAFAGAVLMKLGMI